MNELQQKQLAFLEETANHYNSNNRCKSNAGGCFYSPVRAELEGRSEGCAIGRKLDPEFTLKLDNMTGTMGGSGVKNDHIFDMMPDNLKELSKLFLEEIQCLHDFDKYWNLEGLTTKGKENVESIKNNFGLN